MHPPAAMTTVSAHYALAVANASAAAAPVPGEPLTGIARLPYTDVRRLWDRALGPRQEAGVGLRLGLGLRPSALHVLGHLILTCGSLGEAAATAVRYHLLVSEAGEVGFRRGSGLSYLVYRPTVEPGAMHPQQVEAVVAGMVAAARWLIGPRWSPEGVSFVHLPIGDRADYEEALGCPVTFAAAENALAVPTAELDRPANPADPELAQLHRRYADRLLAELSAPPAVPERVRRWLTHAPLHRVGLGDIQQALNLSERALRRALRDHGTSWSALLHEARHSRACHLLETTDLTTDRIAGAVGLSGAAALGHSFARRAGISPGAYRRTFRAAVSRASLTASGSG